ncbi:ferrous iron transport protein B [Brumimicrobium aurantiacum]|uniref:Ferrous iron transport protein B n=1 Tax=Brumimicrobium aurantiacum TaxID=1737063 RepID=A0A3E1EWQ7_9FLAO|nr:ferrous iron transport protein B [Brumimicrobium aurantiacum]RFC53994.1 ferrous iron transport protein B [Brumimicrobium aurantiacum]
MGKNKKIALVGNPNSGKTSLFNQLTGLNQKVGNYPGVTVDKRSGTIKLPNEQVCELIDLPGTYSLSSKNDDEKVVQDILLNPDSKDLPDLLIIVADGTNLARNLFLASQVIEMGIPSILAINMVDIIEKSGDQLKIDEVSRYFDIPVTAISARKKKGIHELLEIATQQLKPTEQSLFKAGQYTSLLEDSKHLFNSRTPYMLFKQINNAKTLLEEKELQELNAITKKNNYESLKEEILEISDRVSTVNKATEKFYIKKSKDKQKNITDKIDQYVTHPVWGLFIFLAVFFVIFQAIFTFASYPMDLINDGIVDLGIWVGNFLPDSWFTDFIVDGIFAGLAGVFVFVPQIMILFALIAILEDTGYLSRVSFMADGLLKRFGMNGKSVVPLVGGFACAIPAIMAARAIENRKERFITIFITPLMACSARLPVYVFLVSFIAPDEYIWGFVSVQGLYMMGLYLLGFVVGLLVAIVINIFSSKNSDNSFILELPNYKVPSFRNALNTMINKGKIFVVQAGKVILVASIILWVLSYFGPGDRFEKIETKYETLITENETKVDSLYAKMNSEKIENSYLGIMGKTIEPAIQPLGFDWKIGIALVASFAAREVFVGTMSTIYSVEGGEENEKGLKAIKFSYATAFSLLIFYVFALQCMSTIAVVRQETGSWIVTIVQFISFTAIAYVASWLTFNVLG